MLLQERSKEIAARVSVAVANERDESYPLEQIEQAVILWLENRFEEIVTDAVELLTEPRFGYANEFYLTLERYRISDSPTMGSSIKQNTERMNANDETLH